MIHHNRLVSSVLLAFLSCQTVVAKDDHLQIRQLTIKTASLSQREVVFYYRLPTGYPGQSAKDALLLVSGFNGDGSAFLGDPAWTRFADRENLLLIGPTFRSNLEEIQARKGYYHPALGSGQATLQALDEISANTGVPTDKVFLFGFSAGAHFVHRFANWRPGKVAAFVAYSAGWWDEPVPLLRQVPALILCGEKDERYLPTLSYYQAGRALGCPWIWRGYPDTGHEITPAVVAMAQAFLHHLISGETSMKFVGDIQSYEVFEEESAAAKRIPQDLKVSLPSSALAQTWKKNN